MAKTLGDLNTAINDRRRDTSSNSIDMTTVGFRAINSTLQLWNQLHDWPWATEETVITYNQGITHYALPSGFKNPLLFKPYKGQQNVEFARVSQSNFDTEILKANRFAIEEKGQDKSLRLKARNGEMGQVITATQYDSPGTWTAGTGATNVATDSYESYTLSASVSYQPTGSFSTVAILNSTFPAISIPKYLNRGNFYTEVYLPTVTDYVSSVFRIGTDSSNYWQSTVTTDYLGDDFTAGLWATIKGPMGSSATVVGSPSATSIGYVYLAHNYSTTTYLTTSSTFRISNVFVSENYPIIMQYYSTSMVKAASGGAKTLEFTNAANTTDTPLWSGLWDWVTSTFVDSVMELISWETGDKDDRNVAVDKIKTYVDDLKTKLPTRKQNIESQFTIDDQSNLKSPKFIKRF